MKIHKGVIYPVSGSLGKDADGNTGLYQLDGCENDNQPLLYNLPDKKKTVEMSISRTASSSRLTTPFQLPLSLAQLG